MRRSVALVGSVFKAGSRHSVLSRLPALLARPMATAAKPPAAPPARPPTPERVLADALKTELSEEVQAFKDQEEEAPALPKGWKLTEGDAYDMRVTISRAFPNETVFVKFVVPRADEMMPPQDETNVEDVSDADRPEPEENPDGETRVGTDEENNEAPWSDTMPGVPFTVSIVKPTGALFIQAEAGVNGVNFGPVMFTSDSKVALDNSEQGYFARSFHYGGPAFEDLSTELQGPLLEYLESRGINEEMSTYIYGYSALRENAQYRAWLQDVRKFVQ